MINRNSVAAPDKTPRPPKLHLPFETKKTDAGEWAYDHRVGLCITLIAYLVLAIAFMAGKIVVGAKPSVQGIIIDTKTLAELEAEKMRLEQEVRARQQAQEGGGWRDVRNQYSNENALDERAHDDRGSMTSSLKESAEAVGERMQANRDAYEQGLAEERAIRERMGRSGEDDRAQDSRAKGRVTVSFSLTDAVIWRFRPTSAKGAAKWSSALRSILRARSLLPRSFPAETTVCGRLRWKLHVTRFSISMIRRLPDSRERLLTYSFLNRVRCLSAIVRDRHFFVNLYKDFLCIISLRPKTFC